MSIQTFVCTPQGPYPVAVDDKRLDGDVGQLLVGYLDHVAAVAEAEQRGIKEGKNVSVNWAQAYDDGSKDGFNKGQRDMLAKVFNNPDCVWGQGECVPDCPCCKRMDELIGERAAGYKEGLRDMLAKAIDE